MQSVIYGFYNTKSVRSQFPKGVQLRDTCTVSDIVFQIAHSAILSVSCLVLCSLKCLCSSLLLYTTQAARQAVNTQRRA